ncbi:outer membrane protein, (porin) [Caballeronia choica]|uniref:Outer membrane protein, (Porin) n=1 Tax=Caballeronia choica TaxID=326476 RepID=A0A158JJD1_9BURK|nr:porin [Caballeronia choica]SAL68938.1 outer membrane protein, (porin) [Caballeronia choica]
MKRNLMAAVLLGLLASAAQGQSSVTLYGLIDAGITYTNSQLTSQGGRSNVQMTSGAVEGSRWGLRGAEDLGGGLKAIFTLENGFNVNNGTLAQNGREFGRQAFVGLSSVDFGAVTLGRQYDSMIDFVGPLALTGTEYGGTHFAHPFNNDNLNNNSFSINNSIKYQSANYAGFRFGGLYGFSNAAGAFADNRAYSVGASYSWGPLNFAAGYLHLNNGASSAAAANFNANGAVTDGQILVAARQQTWGAGVNYAFGPAVVGFVYTQTNLTEIFQTGLSTHFQNFEGNIRYNLTPALNVSGAYTYSRAGGNAGSGAPHWNQVGLQTDYNLSKRTDVYLQGVYQSVSTSQNTALGVAFINGLSAPSSTTNQVEVTAGLRHRF